MDHKKIRAIGAAVLVVLWAGLTLGAWFGPDRLISQAERRELTQMPELSLESLLDTRYMSKFEKYTLDQFPARDTFRSVKALFHSYVLGQADNNDIYLADGYIAQQNYPLDTAAVAGATGRFNRVYQSYLKESDCKVYAAVVPDKGYYLADSSGHLHLDHDALVSQVKEAMPWATFTELTDCLSIEDYYRTDTHWRQEKLLAAAQRLCWLMDARQPQAEDYTQTALERPFHGVYYGQAAMPVPTETMYIMESPLLDGCTVYNYTAGGHSQVYDMTKLDSMDLYDVFLSGSQTLLTIENPNAATDRELIVFRDSFGSSITPLLVQGYARVTLVDIRYMSIAVLSQFITFEDQDVLFLYSSLVLNNPDTFQTY